jgi:DNA-binding NtrC family response regulator
MPERILVVDDEETICEIIVAMLGGAGYQCQTAESGNSALALLRSGAHFDLIVSGIMMADGHGTELLEQTTKEFPAIPLVFATTVSDHSVALMALRHGARDYLIKPFEREELLVVVRRALETHRFTTVTPKGKTNLDLLVAARIRQLRKALSELEPPDKKGLGKAWRLHEEHG